jgi:hypothetical protein
MDIFYIELWKRKIRFLYYNFVIGSNKRPATLLFVGVNIEDQKYVAFPDSRLQYILVYIM